MKQPKMSNTNFKIIKDLRLAGFMKILQMVIFVHGVLSRKNNYSWKFLEGLKNLTRYIIYRIFKGYNH